MTQPVILEPLTPQDEKLIKLKKRRHRQPSVMQIKALQYMNQGMSSHAAMIKAGYSKESAKRPGQNFFAMPGVKATIQTMANELVDAGLTSKYMVGKMQEWIEAKKDATGLKIIEHKDGSITRIEPSANADYETQIKAFDRWEKILEKQTGAVNDAGKVRRKLTIEEFVLGDKK